ncbi:MAG: hypothetical protein V3U75_01215 [Methylococcaceae bacterium]
MSVVERLVILKKEATLKEVYVLLADGDGTMRSSDEPFGVAVESEEEAKRYVEGKGVGYTHSYQKLTVFDDKDKAIHWVYHKTYKGKDCKFCK